MEAIDAHLLRRPAGHPLSHGLVFGAVRIRLMEIEEVPNNRDPAVGVGTASAVAVDRRHARRLEHRYFDTDQAILTATCQRELSRLRAAVERLLLLSSETAEAAVA